LFIKKVEKLNENSFMSNIRIKNGKKADAEAEAMLRPAFAQPYATAQQPAKAKAKDWFAYYLRPCFFTA